MIQPGGYIRDILTKPVGAAVDAYGWVKTRRDSKGVHFVQLNDGSSFNDLQVVIEAGQIPEETMARATTGACLRASGELLASPGAGQAVELKAQAIHVYGGADPAAYPLQKKGHTMEFLREIAHLRSRTNTFGAIARDFGGDVTMEQAEESLALVQKLDPPGVGARNLRECLLLQLTPDMPLREILQTLIAKANREANPRRKLPVPTPDPRSAAPQ